MTARRQVTYFQYLPGISASGSRKALFLCRLLPDSKTQILLRQELFCCDRLLSIIRHLTARHPGRPCPTGGSAAPLSFCLGTGGRMSRATPRTKPLKSFMKQKSGFMRCEAIGSPKTSIQNQHTAFEPLRVKGQLSVTSPIPCFVVTRKTVFFADCEQIRSLFRHPGNWPLMAIEVKPQNEGATLLHVPHRPSRNHVPPRKHDCYKLFSPKARANSQVNCFGNRIIRNVINPSGRPPTQVLNVLLTQAEWFVQAEKFNHSILLHLTCDVEIDSTEKKADSVTF